MSRKNFISFAISFGLGLRHARLVGGAFEDGYTAALRDLVSDLDSQSATFRRDTFTEFVEDVASHRRDATGSKVKPAKVSA